MPIIKCKMCGGDLNLTEGSTVCECEYCGTKQTVPSADNEKKLTLFGRAGRLLRACEFDKAAGVFETIVADFPQEAEAYWGLVLCKYGIEYVDDPATGKKIPTCHRSSFDSVLDDANFEQACENTDAVARRVYRDEARQIEELRQAILQVSGKEEPYDVFISYKETDEHGERTLDSVIAQDIFTELTEKGYRVFFSRISLEDKLGTEYEPYIFAALNSAKAMLVVGTDYENFDAVWVKNEWSRFLKLIAKGEKKALIPVFKNMDAYDMPKEFAKLAAQDMGKVGAMQDLVRGVEKIVGKKKAEQVQAPPVQQPVYVSGGPNVTAMIERGHQALEDGEWAKADEFFDQALNMDAKCAEAFLGKFLAQEKAVSLDAALDQRLAECDRKAVTEAKRIQMDNARAGRLITENLIPGYSVRSLLEKEIHFDPSYPSTADYYANQAPKEKERLRADRLFTRAERYAGGELAESIKRSVKRFEDALNQKAQSARDAAAKAKHEKEAAYAVHMERAEAKLAEMRRDAEAKREQDYQEACKLRQEAKTIPEYGQAIKMFRSAGLADYKDSAKLDAECRAAIAEMEEQKRQERAVKEEAERRRKEAEAKAAAEEAERQRIRTQKEKEEKKRKKRKVGIIGLTAAIALVVLGVFIVKVIIPNNKYSAARNLLVSGNYEEAIDAFEALDGYKDSEKQILEAKYKSASALLDNGQYEDAILAFELISNYSDSQERISEAQNGIKQQKYNSGVALMESGEYEQAIKVFEGIESYADSIDKIESARESLRQIKYENGISLMNSAKYEEAISLFTELSGYRDSIARIQECRDAITEDTYQRAVGKLQSGAYDDAYSLFLTIKSYKDVSDLLANNQYLIQAAYRTQFELGHYVTMGSFEQDNNTSNGKEPIEWLVLKRDGDKVLLVSRYLLESLPFYNTPAWDMEMSWEKSSLRSWLNGTFYNSAFSAGEKQQIIITDVKTEDSYKEISGGADTKDRVFLLSISEAQELFENSQARMCSLTSYALTHDDSTSGTRAWWLRTMGENQYSVACVSFDGSINHRGSPFYLNNNTNWPHGSGVRPVIWVNIGY